MRALIVGTRDLHQTQNLCQHNCLVLVGKKSALIVFLRGGELGTEAQQQQTAPGNLEIALGKTQSSPSVSESVLPYLGAVKSQAQYIVLYFQMLQRLG